MQTQHKSTHYGQITEQSIHLLHIDQSATRTQTPLDTTDQSTQMIQIMFCNMKIGLMKISLRKNIINY